MKYFPTSKDAIEFLETNPKLCIELSEPASESQLQDWRLELLTQSCLTAGGKSQELEPRLPRIGGWLIFMATGITLSPLLNLYHIGLLITAAIQANWDAIFSLGAMSVASVLFEFAIQIYMLIFSVVLAIAFFEKLSNYPRLFIIYVVSLFSLGIVGALIAAELPGITPELLSQAVAFPIYIFILGLIWIPYLLRSKRVKNTFVASWDGT